MDTQHQINQLKTQIETLMRSVAELENRVVSLEKEAAPKPIGRPVGAAVQRIQDAIEVIRVWNQFVSSESTFAITSALLKTLSCNQQALEKYIKSEAAQAQIEEIHAESGIPESFPQTYNRGKGVETLKALVLQWHDMDKPLQKGDRQEKLEKLVLKALKDSQ